MNQSPIELIISRLERCAPSGKGRYVACCPAHEDRDPSLSITEAHDGRVLIHCFAGCDALSIVEALGLSLSDLYTPELPNYQINQKPLVKTREAAKTVDHWVLEIAKSERAKGKKLSAQDLQREREAFFRVGANSN